MEVRLVELWATPSTLHLRLGIWGPRDSWVQFRSLSIPLDAIASELKDLVLNYPGGASLLDQPLPGMPYTT